MYDALYIRHGDVIFWVFVLSIWGNE